MITKNEFVDIINRLRDYNDLQNKIDDLFRDNINNQEMDFMNAGSICIGHETVVVHLLENIFNLSNDDTLTWWLYDLDYGRLFEIGDLREEDGTAPDLSTAEKLYDYLMKNMKES